MSIRTNFQRALNRLEAQKADDRIPHVLNEADGVEVINKKSGDTYFVKKFNPKTQKLAADAKKEDKKEELSPKIVKARDAKRAQLKDEVLDDFVMDQVSWEKTEDRDKFKESFTKLIDGKELSKEELANINKYAAIKDSDKNAAIYFSTGDPGDFRQGTRKKVDMKGSSAAIHVMSELSDGGMGKADPTSTKEKVKPKLSSKEHTLSKIGAKNGPRTYEVKVGEKDKDGKPSSVTLQSEDGKPLTLRRQPIPDKEALIAEFNEMKKQNKGMSDEEAMKESEKRIKGMQRYNDVIDQYAEGGALESVQLVKDADPFTKEGREKTAKEGPKEIANALEEAIKDKNPTEAEKKVIDRMKKLGEIEDSKEYEKEAMAILKQMNKTPSMSKATPDITEGLVMCAMNKRGVPCVAPKGETYEVADLIMLPEKDLDPNDKDYLKKLAQGGPVVIMMTDETGNLSVKQDGGAASGFAAKKKATNFKNKETSEKLDKVLNNHNNFLPTAKDELNAETIEKAGKELDDVEKWARENDMLEDGPLKFKDGRTPNEWAKDTVEGWIKPTGKMKKILPDDITPENKKNMIAGLTQYAKGGLMIEKIHNKDTDYSKYHNVNANLKEGTMEHADGIACKNNMKFSANPGFSIRKDKKGNYIARPNSVYAGNIEKSC